MVAKSYPACDYCGHVPSKSRRICSVCRRPFPDRMRSVALASVSAIMFLAALIFLTR
jgi:hypothetical protein